VEVAAQVAQTNPATASFSGLSYQGESSWAPATAPMWAAVLSGFSSSSDSGQTSGKFLGSLGFREAENKIIHTPTTYTAEPTFCDGCGHPLFSLPAVCFLDTNMDRGFAHQPWCYNGTKDGVPYGESTDLVQLTSSGEYSGSHGVTCLEYEPDTSLKKVANPLFYFPTPGNGVLFTDIDVDTASSSSDCQPNVWKDNSVPGWLITNNAVGPGYFWPAIDVSNAQLRTRITISDGANTPAVVDATLPWQCKGSEVKTP
jgi:hypothetical protein